MFARTVRSKDVEFDLYVRLKCMECPAFGKRYSCPPYTPSPFEAKERLSRWKYCVLLVEYLEMEPIYIKLNHLSPLKKVILAQKIANAKKGIIDKKFRRLIHTKGFYLGAKSPCTRCRRCGAQLGIDCKKPKLRTHAPESFGIDVYGTLEKVGIPFESPPRFYTTIVGMFFTDEPFEMGKISNPPRGEAFPSLFRALFLRRLALVKKAIRKMSYLKIETDLSIATIPFRKDELKDFFAQRNIGLVVSFKWKNERVIAHFKDLLTNFGFYDITSFSNDGIFPKVYGRALTFPLAQFGIKLNLRKDEILFLSKKFEENNLEKLSNLWLKDPFPVQAL